MDSPQHRGISIPGSVGVACIAFYWVVMLIPGRVINPGPVLDVVGPGECTQLLTYGSLGRTVHTHPGATPAGVKGVRVSFQTYSRQLMAILTLALCARADSIPALRNAGYTLPNAEQGLHAPETTSMKPVYDSAIVQRKSKAEIGVFLIRQDETPGRSVNRAVDILSWIFTAVAKIVLPAQKHH